MGNVVRRRTEGSLQDLEHSDKIVPMRVHQAGELKVESHLSLGVEPTLRIIWQVPPQCWAKGFTLMAFRNDTGFWFEKNPEMLTLHGNMFIETNRDGYHMERPEEGTVYYTFVLTRKVFFGLVDDSRVVRFSETIPTAKVGIGRIKDQVDLQSMLQRHELGEIEHETNMSDAEVRRIHSLKRLKDVKDPPPKKKAVDAVLADEIDGIYSTLDAVTEKRKMIRELKKDPKFKILSKEERRSIIDEINERLDPAELRARRERRS
jgi:hypothetical protein